MPEVSNPLLLGTAQADITPPLGTYLMGYSLPDRFADAIDDPLFARVLAFEQGDCQAALVVLDLCILSDDERVAVVDHIATQLGIPAEHIIVGTIQTHSAPSTLTAWGWSKKDTAYLEEAMPKVVEAAARAWEDREPVSFGVGTGRSDAGINRREIKEDGTVRLGLNPFGAYDPELTVLRFETDDGTKAVLVNYGAHPTTRSSVSTAVSRDFPGVVVDAVEDCVGGMAVFVTGVVGDVAPRCTVREAVGSSEIGLLLAREAMRVFPNIQCSPGPKLDVLYREMELPLAPLTPREEAQARLVELKDASDWGMEAAERAHYRAVIEEWDKGDIKTTQSYQQRLLRIGQTVIVPMPGEAFAEIGLRIKAASPFAHTLIASTTNGSFGYLPTREAYARGSYETQVNRALGTYLLDEKIDDFLVTKNLSLLRELQD